MTTFFMELRRYRFYCSSLVRSIPRVLIDLVVLNAGLLGWLFFGRLLGVIETGGTNASVGFVLSLGGSMLLIVLLAIGYRLVAMLSDSPPLVLSVLGRLSVYVSFSGLFVVLYTLAPTLVFYLASAERTVTFSQWYFALDTKLGLYESFPIYLDSIRSVPWLYSLIDISYTHTMTALLVVVLLLPLFSLKQTYRLMVGIVVSITICVPFWLLTPALAPLQFSVTDTLPAGTHVAYTESVRTLYEDRVDTAWGEKTTRWIALWEQVHQAGFGYAVSANPSMHMAWGVLVVIFLWRVVWWVGLLSVPFLLFEAIGTILFLQHYLIDIPLGLMVGFVTLWLVDRYVSIPSQPVFRFWFSPLLWLNAAGRRLGLRQLD